KPNAVQPASRPAKDVAAKNLVLQAAYILLKRDRLLEAVKLHPEQMMAWSSANRLTGQQDQAAIGADAA
ncbi:MAG: hypothetical protein E5W99_26495, partial [Mesorhizobium sp.]